MLYLNGNIISDSDASINPADRGFLLGDGLFETIRCDNGKPLALQAHWKRLLAGIKYLALPLTISFEEIKSTIEKLLIANNLNRLAAARITITRGIGPRGISIPEQSRPTILIIVFALNKKLNPISLCTNDIRINEYSPLTKFKTLNYLDKIIARQQARTQGFDDAILLNTKNHIVSTTTANIFFVKNNILHTPASQEGALPGITRQQIIELAMQQNIECQEGRYTIDDLNAATEVFITNSLIGVQGVARVNNMKLETINPCIGEVLL